MTMEKIDAIQLLTKLIDIPSPSGNEIELNKYLFNLLKKMDFDSVEKQQVDAGGFNIVAKKGNPKLAMLAHTDVVSPHIPATVKDNKIYGRGSCDTKSCITAMICAAQKALNENIANFAMYFTVGEEKDFRGVKKLVKHENVPFTIVGEPTQLDAVNGHFGIYVLKIISKGKKAHTSNPQKGENAIKKLLKELDKVKDFKAENGSLMTLVKIKGGAADNIVPDLAQAEYSFRISPNDNNNYYKIFKNKLGKDVEFKKGLELKPVLTEIPDKLQFLGKDKTVKYATELSFLDKGMVLGPGNIEYAHADNEHIQIKELRKAVEIYFKILKKYNK